MEQKQRVIEVERALSRYLSSSMRSDATMGELGAWSKRRELFGTSFLEMNELTMMIRSVLRASGEVTVAELVSIFHGALESDIQKALHFLVKSEHALWLGDHRYAFLKDNHAPDNAADIEKEKEVMRRFKRKVLTRSKEPSNTKHEGLPQNENKEECEDDLLVKMSNVAVSDSLHSDHGVQDFDTVERGKPRQSAADMQIPGSAGNLNGEFSSSPSSIASTRSEPASLTSKSSPGKILCNLSLSKESLAGPKGPYRWVKDSDTQNNDENPKSETSTSTSLERSVNDSGLVLGPSTSALRCSTAEDYIRRTSGFRPATASFSSRERQASTIPVEIAGQARYRWTSKASDSAQKDPEHALLKYCRLRGFPTPGYNVTYMPQEKVHYCVLQVADRAFRSYPTLARSHKRAIEVALEKAVTELGITQKLLDDLERQNVS